jgi:microcystin-dependent protein
MYAGTTLPSGYLFCNGAEKSTTTYAALYAVIGDIYATSSPSAGNFFVPNFQNTMPVGSNSSALNGIVVNGGVSGAVYPAQIYGGNSFLGETQLASHSHIISQGGIITAIWQANSTKNTTTGGSGDRLVSYSNYPVPNTTAAPNTFTNSQAQAQFYPPFCAVNFIIKT